MAGSGANLEASNGVCEEPTLQFVVGNQAIKRGKVTQAAKEAVVPKIVGKMVEELFMGTHIRVDETVGECKWMTYVEAYHAITNLATHVFGEQRKLEPIAAERKIRWKKEIDWLLSVANHIVEFVPSQQKSKDGINMEIMVIRQIDDLHMNMLALCKMEAMLIGHLDSFGICQKILKNMREVISKRKDAKWWLANFKVPPEGLSDDYVNQVLKVATAINAQVLLEMEIPKNCIDSLPNNGRYCFRNSIYTSITNDYFDLEQFLSAMDLPIEHKIFDLKNIIDALVIIWWRKMHHNDELFKERAKIILLLLKQRFLRISQSSLSHSRVIESLASIVNSRIEDVIHADSLTQTTPLVEKSKGRASLASSPMEKFQTTEKEVEKLYSTNLFLIWASTSLNLWIWKEVRMRYSVGVY
ncbi:hypothetical protein UlMin_001521 [Ulmus minor]